MRRLKAAAIATTLALGLGAGVTACGGDKPTPARAKENNARQGNYDRLVANQPAHTGSYSPTRATKNFWIDTWMKDPNKLSYVYIQNANGQTGYFILKGLPVTYCVSLLPPEQPLKINLGSDGSAGTTVQAPSMDGSYSSGGDCTTKYGKDATTGAYVEFTVGQSQSYFLYDQPMPDVYKDAKPMGPSKLK